MASLRLSISLGRLPIHAAFPDLDASPAETQRTPSAFSVRVHTNFHYCWWRQWGKTTMIRFWLAHINEKQLFTIPQSIFFFLLLAPSIDTALVWTETIKLKFNWTAIRLLWSANAYKMYRMPMDISMLASRPIEQLFPRVAQTQKRQLRLMDQLGTDNHRYIIHHRILRRRPNASPHKIVAHGYNCSWVCALCTLDE